MAGLSFTHQAFLPAIPAAYAFLEALFYTIATYAAWDIADKTADAIKNRDLSSEGADKETNPGTPNAFPDRDEETDVNGVPVPVDDSGIDKPEDMSIPDAINRKGGGKNGQHANLKAKQSAGEKYEEAKNKLDSISRKPNKTKEDNKLKAQLEKQVKHWKAKAQETGENHSRNAKGNR